MKVCGSRAKALQAHLFQGFMDFHIVLGIRPRGYWWWQAHHPTVSLSQTSTLWLLVVASTSFDSISQPNIHPVVAGGGMLIIPQ